MNNSTNSYGHLFRHQQKQQKFAWRKEGPLTLFGRIIWQGTHFYRKEFFVYSLHKKKRAKLNWYTLILEDLSDRCLCGPYLKLKDPDFSSLVLPCVSQNDSLWACMVYKESVSGRTLFLNYLLRTVIFDIETVFQMGDVQKVNARLSTFISCDSKMKAEHNTKIFSNTYKLYLKTFTYNNVCLNNFQWLYDQILWRSACLPVYLSVLPVSYMKTTFMSYCL